MKINSETLRLLGKELPWVTRYMPKNEGDFYVQIMDLNVLDLCGDFDHKIYFVDKSGQEIGRAKGGFFVEGESVEKAIKRIGNKADDIYYILDYHQAFRAFSIYVTIYKLPKRVKNMRTWLDEKSAEASKDLHEALNG